MCDCEIYDREMKPVKVSVNEEHRYTYTDSKGVETVLLDHIKLMPMNYNRAFCKKIIDEFGFKTGYMFVFGETK